MNSYLRVFIALSIIAQFAFFSCRNNDSETLSDEEIAAYQKKGRNLASSTQKVLASNLMSAVQEEGTINALEFCNAQAIQLTDSMSMELEAHIKRVSDQPRNPSNQANEKEMVYIKSAKESIRGGNDVKPLIQLSVGKVTGYYPIISNQLCMQCHGSEASQIDDSTLEKILELYPEDKATGYNVGELRGIWVVEMEKE